MKEDFVTIEIAKKLKEKGYTGKTTGKHVEKIPGTEREEWDDAEMMYVTVTDVVTYPRAHVYDVLKWLREEKNIHVVCPFYKEQGFYFYVQRVGNAARIVSSFSDSDDCYDTYEQATLAGIEYTLDHLI